MSSQLRALVAQRNVRRIVVHATRQTALELREAPASQQALDVLQAHGFRIQFAVRGDSDQHTAPEAASVTEALASPADRWKPDEHSVLHVVEDGLEVNGQLSQTSEAAALAVPLPRTSSEWTNSLQSLAAEVLGLDAMPMPNVRLFGSHLVSTRQVFYESALSFCLVNLKPIVPGHVLVVPKRCVDRFSLLGADEVSDIWCTAQLVGSVIQREYNASSLTFAIQDGPEAGQTVPHVHIHVIPRCRNDFEANDDVYTEIETHERGLQADLSQPRHARTLEAMAAEATALRALLPKDGYMRPL